MDPMRGINPEEAAAYKRLKSRIFTRVSRGKEGVMPGYGEADIIQEQEKQIATLTAEVESYRVRGWEKSRYPSLAEELRAERDDYKAHFEVCDSNRQQVVAERDAALATIAELREALAKKHALLKHVQKEMEQWAYESGVNYKQAFLANQEVQELREALALAQNALAQAH